VYTVIGFTKVKPEPLFGGDFKPGDLPYKRQMINILIDRDVVK